MPVTVTREFVHAHKTPKGAWTKRQLALLGVPWPPQNGWMVRIAGRQISDAAAAEFAALGAPPELKAGRLVGRLRERPEGILVLYFDGSCKRNPGGPGGWGFRVVDAGTGGQVGAGHGGIPAGPLVTNNVAEWRALIEGLRWLAAYPEPIDAVLVRGDSELVIRQAGGEWRVKKSHHKPLHAEAQRLAGEVNCGHMEFEWLPREQNAETDALSKSG